MLIHETLECKDILQVLTLADLDFAILGGYPRDLKYGIEPKDLDIVIWGDRKGFDLSKLGYVETELDRMPDEYGDPRIDFVIKLGKIDVIFWNEGYETLEEVVANFDHNISQYQLTSALGTVYFLGENEGSLRQVRRDNVSPRRIERVKDVARRIGWAIGPPVAIDGITYEDNEAEAARQRRIVDIDSHY